MNNEGGKTIIINDANAFLEHLSFWHNKSEPILLSRFDLHLTH